MARLGLDPVARRARARPLAPRRLRGSENPNPRACVLGDVDLVRALGLGAIRSVVMAARTDPACYSRSVDAILEPIDSAQEPERMLDSLLAFARRQHERPVLFYDNDWDLLLVSRHRARLRDAFRFVVARPEMVEALVDKALFQTLARDLELPVPAAQRMAPTDDADSLGSLRYPIVAKPLTRHAATWPALLLGKAVLIEDEQALRSLQRVAREAHLEMLVQEHVPGPETRIESYHVYVDDTGAIAGEFTGRKLRTYPVVHGISTAVAITDSHEVRTLGRELVRRLDLRGVAKLDFKRGTDDRLYLLEVNPRFNLWHHPGALAGVNLPALVYADLLGRPRPPVSPARAGVAWCNLAYDARAARQAGMGPLRWLASAVRSEAKSGFAWEDPLPLPRAVLCRLRDQLRWRHEG
ncbi:MAG: ATP-grasp domain-containing protein [Actinomycetota bacterium]|nr:ATP-grasp domain-containing protein [Actinomycetota bacterium]